MYKHIFSRKKVRLTHFKDYPHDFCLIVAKIYILFPLAKLACINPLIKKRRKQMTYFINPLKEMTFFLLI